MTLSLSQFRQITDAEEYFAFFQLPYDANVVNVNRLHILKKFSQFINQIDEENPNVSDDEKLALYQDALTQAYDIFLTAKPIETKLFKVFNEKPKNIVMLADIGS